MPYCLNTCSLKGDQYQSDWKVGKAKKHMLRDTFLKNIFITYDSVRCLIHFVIYFVFFCDEKPNNVHYLFTKHIILRGFMLPFSVLQKTQCLTIYIRSILGHCKFSLLVYIRNGREVTKIMFSHFPLFGALQSAKLQTQ